MPQQLSLTHSQIAPTVIRTGSRLAGWLRRMARTVQDYRHTRRKLRIDRLAFENLLLLDDAILRDIGLGREDVVRASKLPLSQNAALELREPRKAAGKEPI